METTYWQTSVLELKLKSWTYGLKLSIRSEGQGLNWRILGDGHLRAGPVRSALELLADYEMDKGVRLLFTQMRAKTFAFEEVSQGQNHKPAMDPLMALYYCLWYDENSHPGHENELWVQVGSRVHQLRLMKQTKKLMISEAERELMTLEKDQLIWNCQLLTVPKQPKLIVERQVFSV